MKEKKYVKVTLFTFLFLALCSIHNISAQDKGVNSKKNEKKKSDVNASMSMVTYTDEKGIKHTVTKEAYEKYKNREITDEELHVMRLKKLKNNRVENKNAANTKKLTLLEKIRADEEEQNVEDQ